MTTSGIQSALTLGKIALHDVQETTNKFYKNAVAIVLEWRLNIRCNGPIIPILSVNNCSR